MATDTTDRTYRTDDITLAMLSEREARVALADAYDRLGDCTRDFVRCVVSRDDVYLCEVRVHRAQADLQRVLARAL